MAHTVHQPISIPYDQDTFDGSSEALPPYTLLHEHHDSPQPNSLRIDDLSINSTSSVPGAFPLPEPPAPRAVELSQSNSPHVNSAGDISSLNKARSPPRDQYYEPKNPVTSTHGTKNVVPSRRQEAEDLEQIYIAVMGVTGAGKSKFISLCTQKSEVVVGHGLESCTRDVDEYNFVYRDKLVHLIDTPGFDDTNRSDREVLDDIATWLGNAYMQKIKLTGIIYLHRITDPRMTGVALSNLVMFKKLCGEDFYPRVMLVTTMWDVEKKKIAESREKELLEKDDFWGTMVAGGSNWERHYGDRESAMDILKPIVKYRRDVRAPMHLKVQSEMVDQNLSLDETAAGRQVSAKILEERQKYEKKLRTMQDDMIELVKMNEIKAAQDLKRQEAALEIKIQQGYQDQEKLKISFEDLQKRQAQQLQDMMRELEARKEEVEALRRDKDQRQAGLDQINPNSSQAEILREQIAEDNDRIDEVSKSLEEQEKAVEKKKKNFFIKGYEWAKRHPHVVAQVAEMGIKFVNLASKAL